MFLMWEMNSVCLSVISISMIRESLSSKTRLILIKSKGYGLMDQYVYPTDASSEYLSTVDLTDSEDAGRNGSVVTAVQDMTGSQVALLGGSYAGLSPMIIMNNFVLKQVKYNNSFWPRIVYVSTHVGCCP